MRKTKFYDLLGIEPTATGDEIKKAFRKEALRWHPDKNEGDVKAEEKFKEIRHAYEILIDPETRREYDTSGGKPPPRRAPTWSPPRRPNNRGPRPAAGMRFDPDDDSDGDFMFMDEDYIERLFREARAARSSQTRQAMNIIKLGQHVARNRRRGGFGFSSDPEYSPHVCVVIFRLLFDIALNVSAGAAAAAAGAHANGNGVTPRVTQLGAIAGLTKSAITGFVWVVGLLELDILSGLLFLGSGLGVCLVVTVEMANIVLGKIPSALIVAALVSSIFLWPESVNHNGSAIPEVFSWIYCCCIPCCCLATLPGTGLYFLIAFNAIGGAIFAAVAASMGTPICAPHAAAAAGAVYGTISCFAPSIESCMRYCVLQAMLEDPDDLEAFAPLL